MLGQIKPGDVIAVPLWRDNEITTVNVELLPRMVVWLYDGTNLEAPPVKGISTVEEAVGLVRQRHPTAHFADSIEPDHVSLVEDAMERDLATIVFPFFIPDPTATGDMSQTAKSHSEPSAGVIEWFVKLRR